MIEKKQHGPGNVDFDFELSKEEKRRQRYLKEKAERAASKPVVVSAVCARGKCYKCFKMACPCICHSRFSK
jgi:hypothetical protein